MAQTPEFIGPELSPPPVVGTVTKLPLLPSALASGERAFPHTSYSYIRQYLQPGGIMQLPVMAPPAIAGKPVPCQIVRYAAPFSQMICVWSATRIGAVPVLPSSLTNDSNLVFADQSIGAMMPSLMTDATTRIFTVSGWYLYYLKFPVTQYAIPNQPYTTTNPNIMITGNNFKTGI
jgi:hypothetical protein